MKESIVFYGKIKLDKEAQERKFDNELQVLVKATCITMYGSKHVHFQYKLTAGKRLRGVLT